MEHQLRKNRKPNKNDGQDRILGILYKTMPGRLLLKGLTAPAISKAAGAFLSTRLSCVLIAPFIRNNHIDMTQYEPVKYKSYNDFFTRKIKAKLRPVDMEARHFISPCDSKLTVYPVTEDGHFTIKHTPYTVESLLQNKKLAKDYEGGYAMVFRLTVDDYHR